MRHRRTRAVCWIVVVSALGLGAGAARAGTLASASFQILIAGFPPAGFTASGLTGQGSASGTGATAAWSLVAGAVPGGVTTVDLPTSAAPPITQLQVIVNGNPGPGAFAASSPASLAVTGLVNLRYGGGLTLLGVPVTVGQAGISTPPPVSGVAITAFANAWTTKTTSIALLTTGSTGITVMGANGLAGGVGTVVLVTALNVVTNVFGQVPAFAILSLSYVPALPEPGTLALLVGAAGLLHLGRRRRRAHG